MDVEKGPVLAPHVDTRDHVAEYDGSESANGWRKYWNPFKKQLHAYNLETRGIQRVDPSERHAGSQLGYTQIGILWFSINLAANNITLGMLGPAVYYLGFVDASLCAVFGQLIGSLPVAYFAMYGPKTGNRTLVTARYTMGWWPVKLVVVLNIIVLLGYALIDCVVAGQILSAVSTSNISVDVGIVIVAVLTWLVTTFGYQVFHYYERYAWAPQLIVLCILAGVAGPRFDVSTVSEGDATTVIGNRLSFFSLCLSAAITYAGGASDYFVYYPETTRGRYVFGITMIGLSLSFTFAFIIGIGLASGIASIPAWSDAYSTSQGALIVAGFAPLGTFGSFCGVIVALGLIANMIPPTYSSGVDVQILGRYAAKIPRVVWNTLGVIVYFVCAIAGQAHLSEIFTNFLALMGYWVSIWVAITLEDHFLFRRWHIEHAQTKVDWTIWNVREKLPVGAAALTAFLVGWVGAILCMAQVWYIGPIAKLVGDYGADMGNYVGFSWAAVVYPPLRWIELKYLKR